MGPEAAVKALDVQAYEIPTGCPEADGAALGLAFKWRDAERFAVRGGRGE